MLQQCFTSKPLVVSCGWKKGSIQCQYEVGESCVISSQVGVEVRNISWNSRQLAANIQIQAPRTKTWQALTNYESLDEFIPGLTVNDCLERRPTGALLLQVGEQDVALGARFSAKVILDIEEHKGGVPINQWDQQMEYNVSSNPWDISFQMVEGDFKIFNGVWRMEERNSTTCELQYFVYVMPKSWLPVRLIQGRIQKEIATNLKAVKWYVEASYQKQMQ
eukprot:TRINITY_DN13203_c0_g1_i1.p2 TRINITY_DN13203_c0_g1~~TRINITY_DN13203_c0_g1_i1.p2  ORF type:complete len:220 (-),score=32.69 TRINITY_DN13203_c0_g1_i1:313-972(-)